MKVYFSGKEDFRSNFFPYYMNVNIGGTIVRATSESWFQASKATTIEEAIRIAGLPPDDARREGKRTLLRPDWEIVKVDIMRRILMAKFSNPKLMEMLRSYGDVEHVEKTTWHDMYWGICVCQRCRGRGLNMLGKLLTEISRR